MLLERRRGAASLSWRSRWFARLSGVFLAGDLILWGHSVSAIGAGLGTIVPNLQILVVALLAWRFQGERPQRLLLFAAPVMLSGIALIAGFANAPGGNMRAIEGVLLGIGRRSSTGYLSCYSGTPLLTPRQARRRARMALPHPYTRPRSVPQLGAGRTRQDCQRLGRAGPGAERPAKGRARGLRPSPC